MSGGTFVVTVEDVSVAHCLHLVSVELNNSNENALSMLSY